MSRGQPKRPKLNVRTKPEDVLAELAEFAPDDPMRELMSDGRGIDFMVPPPPWDDSIREQIKDNLAILRVDPTHSNCERLEISIVRTIAGEFGFYDHLGQYIGELLLAWDHETAERVFNDILRMKKEAEKSPHYNFHAYKAYVDFMEEFGFQPTRQRLAKFIQSNISKYPVGKKPENVNATEWWDMFFDAGLSRLNE